MKTRSCYGSAYWFLMRVIPFGLVRVILASVLACALAAHADESAPAAEIMKTCFQCNGTGKMKCPVCRDGEVPCPGHCLKLTSGVWVHMDVAGHPPTDVWQKFAIPAGGWRAYNQGHVGHVIALRNGDWVDTGPCPICHGTGKITCPTCRGTQEIVCTLCDGKKVIPESWTAFDNPKMKNRPAHFKMKDGTTLVGKKVIVIGDQITIRTANGDVEVKGSDIASEGKPGGN